MAGTDTITEGSQYAGGTVGIRETGGNARKPILEKSKSVTYNATTSDQIFAVSADPSATAKESIPNRVEIENTGKVPIMLMVGYSSYTDDTTIDETDYVHTLLPAGQTFSPPVRSVISSAADKTIMFGTAVSNTAPNSNEYVDSGADADSATSSGVIGSSSNTTLYLEPYTSATDCTANLFRVGDLIRLTNEIMEVTAIGAKAALATNTLTVKRGLYGSTAASDHTDDDDVLLPFFNAYHDYDKYSVAQTDSDGKFKCNNFFGLGRAATGVQGITPGSVALKFYTEGAYQSLGLSGIDSGTHSGLTASTTYYFTIAVDGGSTIEISFTTDASNLNFGGANGIIPKIQDALNAQFYTAGHMFEKKVTVGIVDGDVRFTSGSNLSTSAIALTAGTSGAGDSVRFFAQANGRIPAFANVPTAVAASLPDDVTYDNVTYATIPNSSAFVYDDGNGRLFGAADGTINYETGAIDFINAPVNAEFVYSVLHTSAFSGKLNEAETSRINSIVDIYANTPSQKWNGSVKVRTF